MADDPEAVNIEDELGAIFDDLEEAPAADDALEVSTSDEEQAASPDLEAAPADISEADTGEEEPPAVEPPASWSADAKAIWPTLDPVAQRELLRREQDWQKADGERAEQLKTLEPYEQALAPVMQSLRLQGVQPAQYVSQLVAADQFLRQDPGSAIQWLAQQYGYDLSQMNQQEQLDIDPTLQPLVQQVQGVQSQLQNLMTEQQQRETAQAAAVVEQFMENPENAYAKRLEAEIFAEIPGVNANHPNASPAERLKIAYDRAVRLSDDVQTEIAAAKAKEAEEKRKAAAAKKAADAKRLADGNLSSKGTNAGDTPQPKDRETELSDLYDRLQGAA